MSEESRFGAALARLLGPLYRISVLDAEGQVTASFGRIVGDRPSRTELPLPNSASSLVIEVDVETIEKADLVIHGLAGAAVGESPPWILDHLDGALDQLILQGETQIGKPVAQMSRVEKQRLVAFLEERGAFNIRKAVDTVARVLGVSRFTVYNYLDSARS